MTLTVFLLRLLSPLKHLQAGLALPTLPIQHTKPKKHTHTDCDITCQDQHNFMPYVWMLARNVFWLCVSFLSRSPRQLQNKSVPTFTVWILNLPSIPTDFMSLPRIEGRTFDIRWARWAECVTYLLVSGVEPFSWPPGHWALGYARGTKRRRRPWGQDVCNWHLHKSRKAASKRIAQHTGEPEGL